MAVNAGDLRERLRVLTCAPDGDGLRWTETGRVWAKAEPDSRKNLFSGVGIGTRGVTFTIRARPGLTLHQAFFWRGRHCFLTDIAPRTGCPGYWDARAALVTVSDCRKDADRQIPGMRFPGVLTEKYAGHDQPDLHAETVTDYVLVTPKAVELAPGSWVTADGAYYRVRVPHLLDPYKNEFEIRRKEDC